ncbi:unnamed protein product, partial [Pylaiella littoralis]
VKRKKKARRAAAGGVCLVRPRQRRRGRVRLPESTRRLRSTCGEQGGGRDVGEGGVGRNLGEDHPLVLQGLRSHPQPRRKRGSRVVHLHVRRQLPRGSSRAARRVGACARRRTRTAPATGRPHRRRRQGHGGGGGGSAGSRSNARGRLGRGG